VQADRQSKQNKITVDSNIFHSDNFVLVDNDAVQKFTTANSTYKKLAVQWLNETLCFVSSSVLADSFVLRNRQLLVAAKR